MALQPGIARILLLVKLQRCVPPHSGSKKSNFFQECRAQARRARRPQQKLKKKEFDIV
jgi:cob(I)alamin adenosyltransferase